MKGIGISVRFQELEKKVGNPGKSDECYSCSNQVNTGVSPLFCKESYFFDKTDIAEVIRLFEKLCNNEGICPLTLRYILRHGGFEHILSQISGDYRERFRSAYECMLRIIDEKYPEAEENKKIKKKKDKKKK